MATKQTPPRLSKRGVWREYADGDWWRLERGTDWIGVTAHSRAMTARDWARMNGYRFQRRVESENVLYVRFTRPTTDND